MVIQADVVRKPLLDEIKQLQIKDLLSLALIGSFQYVEKLVNINDVDIIVLVKKLTPFTFADINKKFGALAKKSSSYKISYVVENRIGPIKPLPKKSKTVIQLHLLIYDLPVWRAKKSKTTTLDWVLFSKTLRGKPLRAYTKISKLTSHDVIDDLQINLENIQRRAAYARVYRIVGNEVKTEKRFLKLTPMDYDENVTYNIITSFLNFIRMKNPKIKKTEDLLLQKAKKFLPLKQYTTLKMAFSIKNSIRQGKQLTRTESRKLQKEGIHFIHYLMFRIKTPQ